VTLRMLSSSFRLVLLATVVIGLGYTFAMTGLAEALFPSQANGSLVRVDGQVVGSRLIGQEWTSPRFFHGRPSATVGPTGKPDPYNAAASAASNLGPTNPVLLAHIRANLEQFLAENPGVKPSQVPPAMVESSGSGLDPDIPLEGALLQVARVARANHLPVSEVRALVERHVHGRTLWIFGARYVNVLELNLGVLRLDRVSGGHLSTRQLSARRGGNEEAVNRGGAAR